MYVLSETLYFANFPLFPLIKQIWSCLFQVKDEFWVLLLLSGML